MARLVLGPLLRYVGGREATVWVESDRPCRVRILDGEAPTFEVEGHHYALVRVEGLEPGSSHPYEVMLDGERAWPPRGDRYPPPLIRTLPSAGALKLAFGSCRVSAPHSPPFTLLPDDDPRGLGADALHALAERLRTQPAELWPQLLLLLGDQVYADDVPPAVLEAIRGQRSTERPHGTEVADFEEYAELYRHAWCEPELRWLLSTVPSAMIWDDHDVHDDWNTSASWLEEVRGQDWWASRIEAAIMSYWLYQHIGNLSPAELDEDPVWQEVTAGEPGALRAFARRAERASGAARWSYARELGPARLVVIDSRAGRVLEQRRRDMLDEHEWRWLEGELRGDVEHLLVATSLPALLAGGLHDFEAWNEAVCAGAWGAAAARLGERMRRALDLEHWAAFGASLERLLTRIADVAAGRHGAAPASVVLMSGDVHHTYLAEVAFQGRGVESAVYQAVSSPVRHPLTARDRRGVRALASRPAALVARALARSAGARRPPARWRISGGIYFDNQVGTLDVDGPRLRLTIDRAVAEPDGCAALEPLFERRLA